MTVKEFIRLLRRLSPDAQMLLQYDDKRILTMTPYDIQPLRIEGRRCVLLSDCAASLFDENLHRLREGVEVHSGEFPDEPGVPKPKPNF